MSPAYEIYPFSIQQLKELIVQKSGSDSHVIDCKFHIKYLEDYFGTLAAKTILVENNYVDRDFLEDYAGYYVRCFTEYKRKCTRFHFFNIEITSQNFETLLQKKSGSFTPENLLDAYLGFIVIKPLPQTVIGRACLKTYPPDGNRRNFPITRNYEAGLFGLLLKVDTLAFQEQDQVAAACATSALWSVFQGTGILFQHPIPSPVEITNIASAHSPLETRTLPNKNGLNIAQMAHAIKSVGLEPFLVRAYDDFFLKGTLYAYLNGKIPILMGLDLVDISTQPHSYIGKHAVAVTGDRKSVV